MIALVLASLIDAHGKPVASPTPTPSAPSNVVAATIALSDESPASGDDVWVRLAWLNDDPFPVRVPSDLFARTTLRVHYSVPWQLSGEVSTVAPNAEPVAASDLEWITVPGFGVVEHITRLEALVPECRGGCRTGQYDVRAELAWPDVTGRARDQIVPSGGPWTFQLDVAPAVLEIGATGAVTAVIEDKRIERARETGTSDQAIFDVTLRNTTDLRGWFPAPTAQRIACKWSWHVGKTPGGTTTTNGGSGSVPWNETDGVDLGAESTTSLTIGCPMPTLPQGAVDLTVVVEIRPVSRFIPWQGTASPLWFSQGARTDVTTFNKR